MTSIVNLLYIFILTTIYQDHRIGYLSNELLFLNSDVKIVHNRTIVKKVYTEMVLNELWYIVEFLFVNIISFLVVLDCKNPKPRTIQIHHHGTVNNHR